MSDKGNAKGTSANVGRGGDGKKGNRTRKDSKPQNVRGGKRKHADLFSELLEKLILD